MALSCSVCNQTIQIPDNGKVIKWPMEVGGFKAQTLACDKHKALTPCEMITTAKQHGYRLALYVAGTQNQVAFATHGGTCQHA